MISEPSETLCRLMPAAYMTTNVPASTSGMQPATTSPVRSPSERNETASTMTIASASVLTKSWIDALTTLGWSETWWISRPRGSSFCAAAISCLRSVPSRRILPPSSIETAMPIDGSPSKNIFGSAGSTLVRRTVAMSPRRKMRPFAFTGSALISSMSSNDPVTRR